MAIPEDAKCYNNGYNTFIISCVLSLEYLVSSLSSIHILESGNRVIVNA